LEGRGRGEKRSLGWKIVLIIRGDRRGISIQVGGIVRGEVFERGDFGGQSESGQCDRSGWVLDALKTVYKEKCGGKFELERRRGGYGLEKEFRLHFISRMIVR